MLLLVVHLQFIALIFLTETPPKKTRRLSRHSDEEKPENASKLDKILELFIQQSEASNHFAPPEAPTPVIMPSSPITRLRHVMQFVEDQWCLASVQRQRKAIDKLIALAQTWPPAK